MEDDLLAGTTIDSGTLMVPSGRPGPQGMPSWSPVAEDFEVPEIGETVEVTLQDANWVQVEAVIFIAGMIGLVRAVEGNTVTLLRVPNEAGVGPQGEPGDASFSPTVDDFEMPPIGGTVEVEVEDASWCTVDAMVLVGEMLARVVSVEDNALTLQREPRGEVEIVEGPQGPQGEPGQTVGPITGVTDGSDAEPGEVGEYIESAATGASFTGNSQWHTATTIELTAGDWDVSGQIIYQGAMTNGLIDITATGTSIGLHPGTWGGSTVISNLGIVIGPRRFSLSETTTIHLLYYCNPDAVGSFSISARRMR